MCSVEQDFRTKMEKIEKIALEIASKVLAFIPFDVSEFGNPVQALEDYETFRTIFLKLNIERWLMVGLPIKEVKKRAFKEAITWYVGYADIDESVENVYKELLKSNRIISYWLESEAEQNFNGGCHESNCLCSGSIWVV